MRTVRATPLLLAAAAAISACASARPIAPHDGAADAAATRDATVAPDAPQYRPDALPPVDAAEPVISRDAACATHVVEAERVPMNLLVLLDRSTSMRSAGKWDGAVRAIDALAAALPDAVRMGLTYFPAIHGNGDTEDEYVTPAVAVAPLATSRASIRASLRATTPEGLTPLACAMPGTTRYFTTGFSLDGTRSVVLITDGSPTPECANSFADARMRVLAAAELGQRHAPPVRTFVVGTPSGNVDFLSGLAVRGGTARAEGCEATSSCHYFLDDPTFEADLGRALADIRGRVASCEFRFEVDSARADRDRINVLFTAAPGEEARLIPRDGTRTDGWDYGPDRASVVLHGASCERVRAAPEARVEILFGCPTVAPG